MSTNQQTKSNDMADLERLTGQPLTLGALLWAIRMGEDWTQVQMAKKLGISRQHLCDLEHDRKAVSPKLAALYADRLGYSQTQFVRLALQNQVDQAGLNLAIEVSHQGKRAVS